MTEKAASDVAYASHKEEKGAEPDLVNDARRQPSVALNIVHNPLKVNFT